MINTKLKDLCNRAGKILQDEQILQTISKCQTELKKREDFRKLVEEADIQAQKRFFEGAINIYNQADQLADIPEQSITKIVRQGFRCGEKVLRPVEVITSKKE